MYIVFTQVYVFVLNSLPAATVLGKQGHSLKSHLTDWKSLGSNLGHLDTIYKVSGLSKTAPYTVFVFIVAPKSIVI